jgi:hypothetical protein
MDGRPVLPKPPTHPPASPQTGRLSTSPGSIHSSSDDTHSPRPVSRIIAQMRQLSQSVGSPILPSSAERPATAPDTARPTLSPTPPRAPRDSVSANASPRSLLPVAAAMIPPMTTHDDAPNAAAQPPAQLSDPREWSTTENDDEPSPSQPIQLMSPSTSHEHIQPPHLGPTIVHTKSPELSSFSSVHEAPAVARSSATTAGRPTASFDQLGIGGSSSALLPQSRVARGGGIAAEQSLMGGRGIALTASDSATSFTMGRPGTRHSIASRSDLHVHRGMSRSVGPNPSVGTRAYFTLRTLRRVWPTLPTTERHLLPYDPLGPLGVTAVMLLLYLDTASKFPRGRAASGLFENEDNTRTADVDPDDVLLQAGGGERAQSTDASNVRIERAASTPTPSDSSPICTVSEPFPGAYSDGTTAAVRAWLASIRRVLAIFASPKLATVDDLAAADLPTCCNLPRDAHVGPLYSDLPIAYRVICEALIQANSAFFTDPTAPGDPSDVENAHSCVWYDSFAATLVRSVARNMPPSAHHRTPQAAGEPNAQQSSMNGAVSSILATVPSQVQANEQSTSTKALFDSSVRSGGPPNFAPLDVGGHGDTAGAPIDEDLLRTIRHALVVAGSTHHHLRGDDADPPGMELPSQLDAVRIRRLWARWLLLGADEAFPRRRFASRRASRSMLHQPSLSNVSGASFHRPGEESSRTYGGTDAEEAAAAGLRSPTDASVLFVGRVPPRALLDATMGNRFAQTDRSAAPSDEEAAGNPHQPHPIGSAAADRWPSRVDAVAVQAADVLSGATNASHSTHAGCLEWAVAAGAALSAVAHTVRQPDPRALRSKPENAVTAQRHIVTSVTARLAASSLAARCVEAAGRDHDDGRLACAVAAAWLLLTAEMVRHHSGPAVLVSPLPSPVEAESDALIMTSADSDRLMLLLAAAVPAAAAAVTTVATPLAQPHHESDNTSSTGSDAATVVPALPTAPSLRVDNSMLASQARMRRAAAPVGSMGFRMTALSDRVLAALSEVVGSALTMEQLTSVFTNASTRALRFMPFGPLETSPGAGSGGSNTAGNLRNAAAQSPHHSLAVAAAQYVLAVLGRPPRGSTAGPSASVLLSTPLGTPSAATPSVRGMTGASTSSIPGIYPSGRHAFATPVAPGAGAAAVDVDMEQPRAALPMSVILLPLLLKRVASVLKAHPIASGGDGAKPGVEDATERLMAACRDALTKLLLTLLGHTDLQKLPSRGIHVAAALSAFLPLPTSIVLTPADSGSGRGGGVNTDNDCASTPTTLTGTTSGLGVSVSLSTELGELPSPAEYPDSALRLGCVMMTALGSSYVFPVTTGDHAAGARDEPVAAPEMDSPSAPLHRLGQALVPYGSASLRDRGLLLSVWTGCKAQPARFSYHFMWHALKLAPASRHQALVDALSPTHDFAAARWLVSVAADDEGFSGGIATLRESLSFTGTTTHRSAASLVQSLQPHSGGAQGSHTQLTAWYAEPCLGWLGLLDAIFEPLATTFAVPTIPSDEERAAGAATAGDLPPSSVTHGAHVFRRALVTLATAPFVAECLETPDDVTWVVRALTSAFVRRPIPGDRFIAERDAAPLPGESTSISSSTLGDRNDVSWTWAQSTEVSHPSAAAYAIVNPQRMPAQASYESASDISPAVSSFTNDSAAAFNPTLTLTSSSTVMPANAAVSRPCNPWSQLAQGSPIHTTADMPPLSASDERIVSDFLTKVLSTVATLAVHQRALVKAAAEVNDSMSSFTHFGSNPNLSTRNTTTKTATPSTPHHNPPAPNPHIPPQPPPPNAPQQPLRGSGSIAVDPSSSAFSSSNIESAASRSEGTPLPFNVSPRASAPGVPLGGAGPIAHPMLPSRPSKGPESRIIRVANTVEALLAPAYVVRCPAAAAARIIAGNALPMGHPHTSPPTSTSASSGLEHHALLECSWLHRAPLLAPASHRPLRVTDILRAADALALDGVSQYLGDGGDSVILTQIATLSETVMDYSTSYRSHALAATSFDRLSGAFVAFPHGLEAPLAALAWQDRRNRHSVVRDLLMDAIATRVATAGDAAALALDRISGGGVDDSPHSVTAAGGAQLNALAIAREPLLSCAARLLSLDAVDEPPGKSSNTPRKAVSPRDGEGGASPADCPAWTTRRIAEALQGRICWPSGAVLSAEHSVALAELAVLLTLNCVALPMDWLNVAQRMAFLANRKAAVVLSPRVRPASPRVVKASRKPLLLSSDSEAAEKPEPPLTFSTEWHGGAASGAVAMFDSRQSSFDQLCVAMKAVQDFAPSIFFADGSHHALLMYLITAGRIIADCLATSFQRPAGAAAGGAAGGASPGASGSSEMSARTDLDLMSVQSETPTEQHGAHLRWGFERLWTAQLPVMRILLVTALNGPDGMTRPEALLAVGAASRDYPATHRMVAMGDLLAYHAVIATPWSMFRSIGGASGGGGGGAPMGPLGDALGPITPTMSARDVVAGGMSPLASAVQPAAAQPPAFPFALGIIAAAAFATSPRCTKTLTLLWRGAATTLAEEGAGSPVDVPADLVRAAVLAACGGVVARLADSAVALSTTAAISDVGSRIVAASRSCGARRERERAIATGGVAAGLGVSAAAERSGTMSVSTVGFGDVPLAGAGSVRAQMSLSGSRPISVDADALRQAVMLTATRVIDTLIEPTFAAANGGVLPGLYDQQFRSALSNASRALFNTAAVKNSAGAAFGGMLGGGLRPGPRSHKAARLADGDPFSGERAPAAAAAHSSAAALPASSRSIAAGTPHQTQHGGSAGPKRRDPSREAINPLAAGTLRRFVDLWIAAPRAQQGPASAASFVVDDVFARMGSKPLFQQGGGAAAKQNPHTSKHGPGPTYLAAGRASPLGAVTIAAALVTCLQAPLCAWEARVRGIADLMLVYGLSDPQAVQHLAAALSASLIDGATSGTTQVHTAAAQLLTRLCEAAALNVRRPLSTELELDVTERFAQMAGLRRSKTLERLFASSLEYNCTSLVPRDAQRASGRCAQLYVAISRLMEHPHETLSGASVQALTYARDDDGPGSGRSSPQSWSPSNTTRDRLGSDGSLLSVDSNVEGPMRAHPLIAGFIESCMVLGITPANYHAVLREYVSVIASHSAGVAGCDVLSREVTRALLRTAGHMARVAAAIVGRAAKTIPVSTVRRVLGALNAAKLQAQLRFVLPHAATRTANEIIDVVMAAAEGDAKDVKKALGDDRSALTAAVIGLAQCGIFPPDYGTLLAAVVSLVSAADTHRAADGSLSSDAPRAVRVSAVALRFAARLDLMSENAAILDRGVVARTAEPFLRRALRSPTFAMALGAALPHVPLSDARLRSLFPDALWAQLERRLGEGGRQMAIDAFVCQFGAASLAAGLETTTVAGTFQALVRAIAACDLDASSSLLARADTLPAAPRSEALDMTVEAPAEDSLLLSVGTLRKVAEVCNTERLRQAAEGAAESRRAAPADKQRDARILWVVLLASTTLTRLRCLNVNAPPHSFATLTPELTDAVVLDTGLRSDSIGSMSRAIKALPRGTTAVIAAVDALHTSSLGGDTHRNLHHALLSKMAQAAQVKGAADAELIDDHHRVLAIASNRFDVVRLPRLATDVFDAVTELLDTVVPAVPACVIAGCNMLNAAATIGAVDRLIVAMGMLGVRYGRRVSPTAPRPCESTRRGRDGAADGGGRGANRVNEPRRLGRRAREWRWTQRQRHRTVPSVSTALGTIRRVGASACPPTGDPHQATRVWDGSKRRRRPAGAASVERRGRAALAAQRVLTRDELLVAVAGIRPSFPEGQSRLRRCEPRKNHPRRPRYHPIRGVRVVAGSTASARRRADDRGGAVCLDAIRVAAFRGRAGSQAERRGGRGHCRPGPCRRDDGLAGRRCAARLDVGAARGDPLRAGRCGRRCSGRARRRRGGAT